MIVTRFAPSPNGPLHVGHALSAIRAHDLALGVGGDTGGAFLLRIEDIDGVRSKPELADAFRRDLDWLGLEWREVAPAIGKARFLSRRGAAVARHGPPLSMHLQPGRCGRRIALDGAGRADLSRHLSRQDDIDPDRRRRRGGWTWPRAAAMTGPLTWHDELAGTQAATPELLGDQVLVRRDDPASYHLAATLDDAADGVTLVTRGRDLFNATHIHRLLQDAARSAGAALAPSCAGAGYGWAQTGQAARIAIPVRFEGERGGRRATGR